jgi:hypothetical protein
MSDGWLSRDAPDLILSVGTGKSFTLFSRANRNMPDLTVMGAALQPQLTLSAGRVNPPRSSQQ